MQRRRSFPGGRWLAHAALAAIPLVAGDVAAQVYKCSDASGRVVYADAPCDASNRPLKLPGEPTKSASSPVACAQLQDERQRLAAEAERNAARGRKESADSIKRRQSLTKAYEARCAGISLSAPPAK